MDKLQSMAAFDKVVQLGSFAAAARELRLSRSAVSKYVIDLEQELGAQLLVRTTRSASPTENGQAYYERCTAILSDQQIDPVQEGFDVTLRIADLPPSSLIARKIAPAHRVICAAPSYLEQRGTPQHPDELRHHACLTYGHLATGNQWKLTGSDGDHWIAIPWTLCSNNAEILRDAAVRSRGIALLPTFIVGADLQQGRLRAILPEYRAPEISIYAIYPQTRHLSVKVRLFIDFLVERFGGRPY